MTLNYLAAKCGVATITTTEKYSRYSPILISFLCRWVDSNHRLLLMREAQATTSATPTLVKSSVHQPASPPVFGGADFYKFLTFIHTNIGYDHSPVPGCGLISLMVFMLKLRAVGKARTTHLPWTYHATVAHEFARRSIPYELLTVYGVVF